VEALQALTDHVIARHYPDAETALDLLSAVIDRQARLIAQWMGLGFIHGVMNTDNAHVAGITIDYGPCAFMDAYSPGKVFSSIDHQGRYAYGRQPEIAVWNMAQMASALLPLIDSDQNTAIEKATAVVHEFPDIYADAWLSVFRAKMGLIEAREDDADLLQGFLSLMARDGADFTNTFRALADGASPLSQVDGGGDWYQRLAQRRSDERAGETDQTALMQRSNPAVIPRNHRIEEAIAAGVAGDMDPFETLAGVLATPYSLTPENAPFAQPPEPEEEVRQTFCGT